VRCRFPVLAMTLALLALVPGITLSAGPAQTIGNTSLDPFPLSARSAILIDQATGRVLYQHNPDQSLVPASLTKLMSLHIVYQKLQERFISRNDVVALSANAWEDNQAPGSTLMHLGPGQIVTVEELMKGVAIASGNDAAVALAEYVAGSSAEFVKMMNDEARFMGFRNLHFTDPAGVDTGNRVTAREFAEFCRRYVALHPEALNELHSLREFDYPLPQNMPDGRLRRMRTVKQFNGNFLVWDGIGVDGLKTGHLDDENFTAATTARRGDTRLIAVVLGVPGRTLNDGARNRTDDTMGLLSYGFRNYATYTLDPPLLRPARVWSGMQGQVDISPARPVELTLRRDEREALTCTVLLRYPLVAPVAKGQKVGDIVYASGDEEVGRIPLLAAADVDAGGLLHRTWDSVTLSLTSLAEGATDMVRSALDTARPATVVSAGTSGSSERRTP
jgi:D-alanyl-D-alanine carboxypeptidase (penicillin-binding protein 5/6)